MNKFFESILARLKTSDSAGMTRGVLAAVETMNDGQRWRHMLDLGRRAHQGADADARRQIAALAASDNFFARRLALMACCTSGDADVIAAALVGSSTQLAVLACRLAADHLDEAQLADLLPQLSARRRSKLARACVRRRRHGVVAAAFDRLARRDQAALLACAGSDFVRARLADPAFAATLGPQDWARIGRAHPAVARDALAAGLAAGLDSEAELAHHVTASVQAAIPRIGERSPPDALALLQAAAARAPLALFAYGRLATIYPQQIAALILRDDAQTLSSIPLAVLRKTDDDTRLALLRLRGAGVHAHEFRRLDSRARKRLYEAGLVEAARADSGALPAEHVGLLPLAARVVEARRAWTAPKHAAHPAARLPYLACLPFDEAQREGLAWSGQPDGDLRAIANAAMIGAGRYEPAQLAAVLAFVAAKKNEQDPVRAAMLNALADLPPTRWRSEHLPALTTIIDAALAARDASQQTLSAAARLVMGVAPQHIDFTARELARLCEKLGQAPHAELEGRLTDAQMATLTPPIVPLLNTWLGRSQSHAIVGFLRSFGRRLRASGPLLEVLVNMTSDSRQGVAGPALELLASSHAPGITDALIPKLLKDDPSWIRSPIVADHLHRWRQDLLTEFLRPRTYGGRFSTHKTPVVPSFSRGFERWAPSQQALYAGSLFSIARSSQRSLWELRGAVSTLAAMPAADAAPIEALASLATTDAALRDLALTALGRLDGQRGVPVLTQALDDERARIAIYALRQPLLDMPAGAAIEILRRAPLRQVTVAKEVVRLAGDVESDEAQRFLAAFVAKDDLHRDVRIAMLRALWSYLEDDDTWRVLRDAATRDAATARSTIRIPQDRLSPQARARLAEHLALLLRHDSSQVRLETLQRLVSMPVAADGAAALRHDLHALLAKPTDDEVSAAAAALTLCTSADGAAALGDTFAAAPSPRALQAITGALIEQGRTRPARIAPVAHALVDRLLSAKRHTGLAMRLAVGALAAAALEDAIRRLADEGALHAGVVIEALGALPDAARSRRAVELDALEPRLAAMDDPAARRIGLAMLASRAQAQGWSEHARARLETYRGDRSPLVLEAAELTFPPARSAAEPTAGAAPSTSA